MTPLTSDKRASGEVTVSTRDHGGADVYAARAADVREVVCLPGLETTHEVEAVYALNAGVRCVFPS